MRSSSQVTKPRNSWLDTAKYLAAAALEQQDPSVLHQLAKCALALSRQQDHAVGWGSWLILLEYRKEVAALSATNPRQFDELTADDLDVVLGGVPCWSWSAD